MAGSAHRIALTVLSLGLTACSNGLSEPEDQTPPFTVIDLRVEFVLDTYADVSWTAPGDDDRQGTASRYEVRFLEGELTDATWSAAAVASDISAPQEAGSIEVMRVAGLAPGTAYQIGMRTFDDRQLGSGISNVVSVGTGTVPVVFESTLGSGGFSPDGSEIRFRFPRGLAIDNQGRAFVADERNERVQVLDTELRLISFWGGAGTNPGQFSSPWDVGLNSNDRVYVVDQGNHRIQRFGASGQFQSVFGGFGSGVGFLRNPEGIEVTSLERVVVADTGNERVQVFDAFGGFLLLLEPPDAAGWIPRGVGCDEQGNIYVTDSRNQRVAQYSDRGQFQLTFGSPGSGDGQFMDPVDVAGDDRGNVLVADQGNHRIQVFSTTGEFRFAFGEEGTEPGQLSLPHGVDVDGENRIWVVEAGNGRISIFLFP